MKKWLLRIALFLLVLTLSGATVIYFGLRELGFFREPVFETGAPLLPELRHPAVLVFSKTNAFIHREAIPAAQSALRRIGKARGWSVYLSDNGAIHNARDLQRFDAVVWNNVTGEVLDAGQKRALRDYLEQGGGFVALHSSGDSSHEDWPWYMKSIIRVRFVGHPMLPQFQRATVRIEQPADPIMAGEERAWTREDEWYSFAGSPRADGVRILATLDEQSYQPEAFGKSLRMGADHPVIWKHCVGAGRVFYSAMGHTAESYAEPRYLQLLERAVTWAARFEPQAAAGGAPLSCEEDAGG